MANQAWNRIKNKGIVLIFYIAIVMLGVSLVWAQEIKQQGIKLGVAAEDIMYKLPIRNQALSRQMSYWEKANVRLSRGTCQGQKGLTWQHNAVQAKLDA